jgi:cysteinyl-tRNA synthetase
VFPHHENEIAHSRCAFHTPAMANYWMHNGFLQVDGEKMAKSLGNFVTIHELLETWLGGAIRFAMLQTHYRQPINWTTTRLMEATSELSEWVYPVTNTLFDELYDAYKRGALEPDVEVIEALADDLNTSEAITRLREIHAEGSRDSGALRRLLATCYFLGLLSPQTTGAFLPGAIAGTTILTRYNSVITQLKVAHANNLGPKEESARQLLRKYGITVDFKKDGYPVLTTQDDNDLVERLIKERTEARSRKNWKESDRIRDELTKMGVILKDKKDGTTEISKPPLVLVHDVAQRLIEERNEAHRAKNLERVDQINRELKSLGFDVSDNEEGAIKPKGQP